MEVGPPTSAGLAKSPGQVLDVLQLVIHFFKVTTQPAIEIAPQGRSAAKSACAD
jgi:hypothetical protein